MHSVCLNMGALSRLRGASCCNRSHSHPQRKTSHLDTENLSRKAGDGSCIHSFSARDTEVAFFHAADDHTATAWNAEACPYPGSFRLRAEAPSDHAPSVRARPCRPLHPNQQLLRHT